MVREMFVGEEGDGDPLRESGGELPGVLSREWRKLELRVRTGSLSSVGSPVALVVVVHVDVDIRRIRLGGRLRRRRCDVENREFRQTPWKGFSHWVTCGRFLR